MVLNPSGSARTGLRADVCSLTRFHSCFYWRSRCRSTICRSPVAGPIIKARNFIDQIRMKIWHDIDWASVRRYLIAGYFLKIFEADNLAEQTAMLTIGTEALAESGLVQLMAMLYAYGFQIFADFAGYSLIAIGLGLMFGYRLPENFNFPYLSRSISEFWRRWHISLSAWLRDYL